MPECLGTCVNNDSLSYSGPFIKTTTVVRFLNFHRLHTSYRSWTLTLWMCRTDSVVCTATEVQSHHPTSVFRFKTESKAACPRESLKARHSLRAVLHNME